MPIRRFTPIVVPDVNLEVVVDLNNFPIDSRRKGSITFGVFNRDLQFHLKTALLVLFEVASLLKFDNCASTCRPTSFVFAPVLSDQMKSKAFYVFRALRVVTLDVNFSFFAYEVLLLVESNLGRGGSLEETAASAYLSSYLFHLLILVNILLLRLCYVDYSFSFESRNRALFVHPVLFIDGLHLRAKQIVDVQLRLLLVVYGEIHARHEPVRDLHRKGVRHHAWTRWSIDILMYGKDEVDNAFTTIVRLPPVRRFATLLFMPLLELRSLGPMQSNRQKAGVKAWLS